MSADLKEVHRVMYIQKGHRSNSSLSNEYYRTSPSFISTVLAVYLSSLQETLFGRTVTPAERLRQHQRSLTKAQRELDRERAKLEQSEKKLIMDIKKSAKAGQLVSLLIYDHHRAPCLDSPPERLQGHGKRSSQNTEICPKVLSNAHSAAGSRASHTDAEEQSTDGRRYAWRNTRACPSFQFTATHLSIYRPWLQ